MTPDHWQRVRDIFEALLDVDSAEVQRRLDVEAGADPEVRAEVASLLEHHSRAGGFLARATDLDVLGESATHPSPLLEGTRLGPYSVVREVGRGGMGQVYLATDTRLQRLVCLKAVRGEIAANPAYRERLRREARLAASLSHPGICAVHALEEFDGHLYLVTEYVEGRTLRDEIQGGGRPSPQSVVTTMRDLADALGAAHAKGIAHRDLKPENVMRSSDGRLKILDFGLARADEATATPRAIATMPGVLVGTLAYMAPEQINGGPTGRRADIFALGVLIYELAAGTHPFAGPTPLATVSRILEHDPEPLQNRRPDLPSTLVAAVQRCLQKRPVDRFATASDVPAALEGAAGERPGAATRGAWWRVHQMTAIGLYLVACIAAWMLKEWEPSATTRWAFLLIGVLAAINGVVRGHRVFTERAHPRRLTPELKKTRRLSLGLDLGIAVALFVPAGLASATRPVPAVLVMGLAAGIVMAAVFIEPATTSAAFDETS